MTLKKTSRLHLLNEFESAPHSALFNQQTIAAVLNCSTQLLERNRWAGGGVPYLKIGRKVLYRKSDVLFTNAHGEKISSISLWTYPVEAIYIINHPKTGEMVIGSDYQMLVIY